MSVQDETVCVLRSSRGERNGATERSKMNAYKSFPQPEMKHQVLGF